MPKYQQDKRNANRGTARGKDALRQSLERLGAGRSVLVDKHGVAIAGNKTLEAAGELGLTKTVEVETDGSTLVVVKRTDLDLETDIKARELAFADNRVGELDLEWDPEVLKTDLEILKSDFLDDLFENIEVIGDTDYEAIETSCNLKSLGTGNQTKRVLIGEMEFGITENTYNLFLNLVEKRLLITSSQRLAAQEVFENAFRDN